MSDEIAKSLASVPRMKLCGTGIDFDSTIEI
jgi:hypothetical protein